jgi:multidrug efflux pump
MAASWRTALDGVQQRLPLLGVFSDADESGAPYFRFPPDMRPARPNGLNDEPQHTVTIDREKANAQSVGIADINTTLSAAWGAAYISDFIDRGQAKRVYIQGESDSCMLPDQLDNWYVRNSLGQTVRFSTFAAGHCTYGSPKLERYEGVPSIEILHSRRRVRAPAQQ